MEKTMQNNSTSIDEDYWVIWNGAYGIVDTVSIARTHLLAGVTFAWLEEPYDMVGPFNLDELIHTGILPFEACLLMSSLKWQEEQVQLRRESIRLKREAMARAQEQQARFNHRRQTFTQADEQFDEQALRASLNLPAKGTLKPSQIKAAFRRLAQKAHPDLGGSHEAFVRVTQARDALLQRAL
jgi:hypothetical protein